MVKLIGYFELVTLEQRLCTRPGKGEQVEV